MKLERYLRMIVPLLCAAVALVAMVNLVQAAPTSGTVTICDDYHLGLALSGGGTVTFNCGGPATLIVTSTKTIAVNTTLAGLNNGNPLTLTASSGIRLFQINSGAALTISNLTIANLNYNAYPIYVQGGSLIISNTTFTHNSLHTIYGTNAASVIVVANSQFISNTGSAITTNGPLTVTDSLFQDNYTDGCGNSIFAVNSHTAVRHTQFISNSTANSGFPPVGGAICSFFATTLDIADSTFTGNHGGGTGGLLLWNGTPVVTITASSFTGNSGSYGPAIYDEVGGAVVTISNTTFFSNTSTSSYGTIYLNSAGPVQLLSTTFQSNAGGVLWVNGGGTSLLMADSQFVSNTSTLGPGVASTGATPLTVQRSNFIGNSTPAFRAGALHISGPSFITGSVFLRNAGGSGGAINLTSGTSTIHDNLIVNTIIAENTSAGDGGGIKSGEVLTLSGVIISGNVTTNGGGAGVAAGWRTAIDHSLFYSNTALVNGGGGGLLVGEVADVVNTTFYNNHAFAGGGVLAVNGNSNLTLTNITLISNTATYTGGNVRNTGFGNLVLLHNTIVAGGTPQNCATDYNTVASAGHNLASDATCALTGTLDLTNTNPLLGPFANNGGPTYSFMPTASSPAINTGDNTGCPIDDQRYIARPIGSACDIGAIESPYVLTPQAITFNPLPDRLISDPPFIITATASSNLPVVFNAGGVCSVNSSTVTLSGVAGSCIITATQAGNATYAPAAPVAHSFNVTATVLLTQSITFNPLPDRKISDAPFFVSATATSGLSVTFTSLTTSVCNVSGNLVTLLHIGTCTVRAAQAGNTTYAAAVNVDQSFLITDWHVYLPLILR